jgi:hypothetical protein
MHIFRGPVAALAAAALVFAIVGTAPAPALAGTYHRDVYFSGGYERQVDDRTCVPASISMMLNFIARDDLGLSQMAILRYAQPRDALNDSVQRGTDPLGWAIAATRYSDKTGSTTTYQWEAYGTEAGALRRAARQIARTGKPVGLLVSHGRHAVVMTGFESDVNPATGWFDLLRVWISDPYGWWHRAYDATASPLDTYRELDATATYDALWYNKYVIVVPQD